MLSDSTDEEIRRNPMELVSRKHSVPIGSEVADDKSIYASAILLLILIEVTSLSYWPPANVTPSGIGVLINSAVSYGVFLISATFIAFNFKTAVRSMRATSNAPLIVFLAWAIFCSVLSLSVIDSLRITIKILILATITSVIFVNWHNKSRNVIANFSTLFLVLNLAAIVVIPDHAVESGHLSRAGAWRGLLPYKTQFGVASAILFYFSILLPRHNFFFGKFQRLSTITGLLVLLIGSQSRIAMLAALMALFVLLVFIASQKMPKLLRIGFFFFCAALTPIVILALPRTAELVTTSIGRDLTLSGRTTMWEYFWREVLERPLTGYGPGAYFSDQSNLANAHFLLGWESFASAHSSVVEWALAAGIPGMVLFLVMTVQVLWRAANADSFGVAEEPYYVGLAVVAIVVMSVTSMAANSSIIWFVIFFIVFAGRKTTGDWIGISKDRASTPVPRRSY